MTLYSQIEDVCSAIKHNPENVDLYHVCALLRRCQVAIETAQLLTDPALLNLHRTDDATVVTLTKEVDNELVPELLAWLHRVAIEDVAG